MRPSRSFAVTMALVGSVALASAQASDPGHSNPALPTTYKPPVNNDYGALSFASLVGSFKLLGSDVVPAQGTLEMTFNGTVLVSGLQKGSTISVSGNVRKEYETADHLKTVYFGTGRLILNGKVRAVQFFGRDLKAHFYGIGIVRLYGEFDKNLETGFYWYDGGEKFAWGTGGIPVVVPSPLGVTNKARVRINKSGG